MTNLIYFENCKQEDLIPLISDNVTYSVLIKILGTACKKIFTDQKNIIICHSTPPYPVWVWCNDLSDNNLKTISNCIKNNFALEENYNIILSQDLLDKLQGYDNYFTNVSVKMPLLSYRLDKIKEVNYPVKGEVLPANQKDFDYLTKIYSEMVYEMEGFNFDKTTNETKIKEHLERKDLFTFVNERGKIVATTACNIINGFGKIACVYTLPKERRKGYAINLVYSVCKDLVSKNITPILYTNGSYEASNECYKKIGFYKVGTLVNIQKA